MIVSKPLVIGTRGSALALRQTQIVADALRAAVPGIEVETRTIHTEGDRRTDVSLEEVGGQGVFVKDIERDLLSGAIDIAVHSLKDMPAETPAGLTIAAVLPRADVRDALVTRDGKTIYDLPEGARVGTDSQRRSVQLLVLRPDLKVESIRGNVDTRIAKAESGEYDAVVLAAAGLERLGLLEKASQIFEPFEMLPAPGQGALAIQARSDDAALLELLKQIDDIDTHEAITAERSYLARLGAGCRLPVGALARVEGKFLNLEAILGRDSGEVLRDARYGLRQNAFEIGETLADWLKQQGDALR